MVRPEPTRPAVAVVSRPAVAVGVASLMAAADSVNPSHAVAPDLVRGATLAASAVPGWDRQGRDVQAADASSY